MVSLPALATRSQLVIATLLTIVIYGYRYMNIPKKYDFNSRRGKISLFQTHNCEFNNIPAAPIIPEQLITAGGGKSEINNENHSVGFQHHFSFDSDFAEAISKPLPEWYVQQQAAREIMKRELEERKVQLLEEFRKKYSISEEDKKAELAAKEAKRRAARAKSKPTSWSSSLFGSKSASASQPQQLDDDDDLSSLTTKEKWDSFVDDEEKTTGFNLPGFFEVFPELKFKWPIWSKRRNGGAIKCERDSDCPFPAACCNHPILPGEKFCCTGWGKRVMVPAYQVQEIMPAPLPPSNGGGGLGRLSYYLDRM